MLLKESSQKKSTRKIFSCKIMFQFTNRELKSFELVQSVFENSRFLIHFDFVRQFLIDLNAFKKKFEAFIYYLKREDVTKSTAIEAIVFLNKTLISIQKRYWFIELEIAVVVWIVKKLHHMIRAFKHLSIIWIDHAIIAVIARQTKTIISNTDKLNLRLIRVEMYLSQLELNIWQKIDRDHVISTALFRLSCFDEKFTEKQNADTLNDIKTYVDILIKMSSQFKNRLVQDYKTNKQWSALYEMLVVISLTQTTRREIINIDRNTTKISEFTHDNIEFERREDLVYYLNRFTFKTRLCVSSSLLQNIFKMTHNDLANADFHRTFVTISKTLYIRRFAHHLRQYIEYFSQCLLNQTKRHKSYELLVFISFSKILFHIISMNFILALFLSKKFDIILMIIDKFFKEKLLMSNRNGWKVKNWVLNLLKYLQLCNWECSRAIISDRDVKFRFELWKWIFKSLNTNLLIKTVYHSQTDELFERINQTIEIALRYLLILDSNFS
jgi:hypothetical protein